MVDRAALEMRSTRKGTGGSNPSLSAKLAFGLPENDVPGGGDCKFNPLSTRHKPRFDSAASRRYPIV